MKGGLFLITISACLLFMPIYASVSQSFYDDFEYDVDLVSLGYTINNENDLDMVVETNNIASYAGEKGLLIRSQPNKDWIEVVRPLDVEFRETLTFSFYIYQKNSPTIVRIRFGDGLNSLTIDYGENQSSWQVQPIYNMKLGFEFQEWQLVNRSLANDIQVALDHDDSPYRNFIPKNIFEISFIHDTIGNMSEVYLDEIIIGEREKSTPETLPVVNFLPISIFLLVFANAVRKFKMKGFSEISTN